MGRSSALKKLDYVEKLCYPTGVDISTLSRQTLLDGGYGEFHKLLVTASACNWSRDAKVESGV